MGWDYGCVSKEIARKILSEFPGPEFSGASLIGRFSVQERDAIVKAMTAYSKALAAAGISSE